MSVPKQTRPLTMTLVREVIVMVNRKRELTARECAALLPEWEMDQVIAAVRRSANKGRLRALGRRDGETVYGPSDALPFDMRCKPANSVWEWAAMNAPKNFGYVIPVLGVRA